MCNLSIVYCYQETWYQIDKKRLTCQRLFTFQAFKGNTTMAIKSNRLHYFGITEKQYHCLACSSVHSFSCV